MTSLADAQVSERASVWACKCLSVQVQVCSQTLLAEALQFCERVLKTIVEYIKNNVPQRQIAKVFENLIIYSA